jgi:hypothetical protein
MGQPVVTVASGGRPVVVSTNGFGMPVDEATNGRGIPVTQVTAYGMPVIYVTGGNPIVSPVLTLTSPTTDTTPDFTLTGDLAAADVIRFQYANNSSFTGATDITHTITAPEDAANSFSFSTGALANGTWYFRARVERPVIGNSNYSNVVTETIATSSYAGPGDVVASAAAWWGLRAYNAAYATGSNPAIDIVKGSDGTAPMTINILSSGALDVATILALGYAVRVSKIYDQSGHSIHLTQPTLSKMPVLTIASSVPTMVFDGVDDFLGGGAGAFTMTQPFTYSGVFTPNSAQANSDVISSQFSECDLTFNNGTPVNAYMYAGTISAQVTCDIGSYHAVQALYNNTTSKLDVDGSNTTVSAGTGAPTSTSVALGSFASGGGLFAPVSLREAGMWNLGFTAGNITSMSSNQHTYWGF